MKFQCNKCSAKYSVNTDKIKGKRAKVKCKKCGAVIQLQRRASTSAATPDPIPEEPILDSERSKTVLEQKPLSLQNLQDLNWYYLLDQKQIGPINKLELIQAISSKYILSSTLVWHPTLDQWKQCSSVSLLKEYFGVFNNQTSDSELNSELLTEEYPKKSEENKSLSSKMTEIKPATSVAIEKNYLLDSAQTTLVEQPESNTSSLTIRTKTLSRIAVPLESPSPSLTSINAETASTIIDSSIFHNEHHEDPASKIFTEEKNNSDLLQSNETSATNHFAHDSKDEEHFFSCLDSEKNPQTHSDSGLHVSVKTTEHDPFSSHEQENDPFQFAVAAVPEPSQSDQKQAELPLSPIEKIREIEPPPPGESTRVFLLAAGVANRAKKHKIYAIVAGTSSFILVTTFFLAILGYVNIPYLSPIIEKAVDKTGLSFVAKHRKKVKEEQVQQLSEEEKQKLRESLSGEKEIKKKHIAKRAGVSGIKNLAVEGEDPNSLLSNLKDVGGIETDLESSSLLSRKENSTANSIKLSNLDKALLQNLYKGEGKVEKKVELDVDLPIPEISTGGSLSSEQIQRVYSRNGNSIKLCYTKALKENNSLRGKMEVQVTVESSGKVTSVETVTEKFQKTEISSCIQKTIQRWLFPPFSEQPVNFMLPFIFQGGS